MSKMIGIDLGTTNSCVTVMEGGEAVVIANAEGARTTPSVVAFTKDDERLVGAPAKRQAVTNPTKTISSIKRFMGRTYDEVGNELKEIPYEVTKNSNGVVQVKIDDKEFTPPEISAIILQKLKQAAEAHLGQKVTEAVVTVPAYFNDAQRQATKDAGIIAGLDVKRIVNEPTAAALAFGLDKKNDGIIAVYDLGGGTFDISILEIGDGVFEVKSTNGNTHLGGDDFDQRVISYLAEEFIKSDGIDLRKDPMARQRLKESAEKAKIELSSASTTQVNLPFITANQDGPKHLDITLSRAKFDELTHDLVEDSITPCRKAVKDAGVELSEITEVILVGGSTRIPAVKDAVKSFFGKINESVNPDEVVAQGAGIQAGILSGDVDTDMVLLDVTPLSLGIETLGSVRTVLIDANTTIPTKKTETFSTAADNQPAVDIHVLQGERQMAADNKTVGRFQLDGISPAPRGVPQIEVSFDIDANGILSVSAKDKATGKEQNIKIEVSSGLTDAEIEKMKAEAKANEAEDKKKREAVDVKNSADQSVFQTEKLLKDNDGKIDAADVEKLNAGVEKLKEVMKTDNTEEIKKATEEHTKVWHEVSQKMAAAASADGQNGAPEMDPNAGQQADGQEQKEDKKETVEDADFEVVDEEEEKKK